MGEPTAQEGLVAFLASGLVSEEVDLNLLSVAPLSMRCAPLRAQACRKEHVDYPP